MTAEQLASMANKTEAKMLEAMTADMRDWYLGLPRESRVQIAQQAFVNAANALRRVA